MLEILLIFNILNIFIIYIIFYYQNIYINKLHNDIKLISKMLDDYKETNKERIDIIKTQISLNKQVVDYMYKDVKYLMLLPSSQSKY